MLGSITTFEISIIIYIYLQSRIFNITLNVGNTRDNIITGTDIILYKLSTLFTQTSIDILAMAIVVLYLVLKIEKRYKNYISDGLYKSTEYIKYSLLIYISIMYLTHKYYLYNNIELTHIYPLHTNYISAIHPPILLMGLMCISVLTNLLFAMQYGAIDKTIIHTSIYNTLNRIPYSKPTSPKYRACPNAAYYNCD